MGLIRLRSTNPRFSYVLRKNPESGMQIRKIRQGYGFGWYTANVATNPLKEYNMYFRDYSTTSYPETGNEVDYLNRGCYVSPQMYLDLLDEFISLSNKDEPDDPAEIFEQSLTLSYVKMFEGNLLKALNKVGYRVEVMNCRDKYGTVIITTRDSLKNLVNYVRLICVLLISTKKSNSWQPKAPSIEWCQKYATLIEKLDLDFYLRYYFSKTFLISRATFDKIRPILEKSSRYRIELVYGDTAVQRSDFVSSEIDMSRSLLDVGCGNGYYLNRVTKLAENGKCYYGVDTDLQILDQLRHKIEIKEYSNAFVFENLKEALETIEAAQLTESGDNKSTPEPMNVLLLEVIEHMEKEEAATLIRQILEHVPIAKLLISTPNAEFNQFYSNGSKLRHKDHHWEMTTAEFSTWLTQVVLGVKNHSYSIRRVSIGHRVNGIATTQGAVIETKT
jgi:2-polyprenyl-3-methyl-5-hydroxy-6-metoxy-1,4-benzoquinol methylase